MVLSELPRARPGPAASRCAPLLATRARPGPAAPSPQVLDDSPVYYPFDVRSTQADTADTKDECNEVQYVSNPTPAHLQKQIGMELYLELVKVVSEHPLFKPLVLANWPVAMGCGDILSALRKLANCDATIPGSNILAEHIFGRTCTLVLLPPRVRPLTPA